MGEGAAPYASYRHDLLDGLVAALTLKPIPAKKLLSALEATPTSPGLRRRSSSAAVVRGETHTIGGETYEVVDQLNLGGNASITRVKDARGDGCACICSHITYTYIHICISYHTHTHRYVLKTSNEAAIMSEVAARKAVGWNRHDDFLLKVSSKPDTS